MPSRIIVSIEGTTLSEVEKVILKHPEVAGVILFTRNLGVGPAAREGLLALNQSILSINPSLFITVDHEGGDVQRFHRHGFTPLARAALFGDFYDAIHNHFTGLAEANASDIEALAQKTSTQLIQREATLMASELHQVLVHSSLAPIVDIDNKSPIISGLHRAYHRDPELVFLFTSAWIHGMRQQGMPSVGKHFPGHGSVAADSHKTMPHYHGSLEELSAQDLKPFKRLIETGLLDAVMTAHVVYTSIDPHHIASYSSLCLQGLLRAELGFKGLVMSDCLGMAGADIGNLLSRAQKALEAGCDMLIVSNQVPQELLTFLEALSPFKLRDTQEAKASEERVTAFKKLMPSLDTSGGQDVLRSSEELLVEHPYNRTTEV